MFLSAQNKLKLNMAKTKEIVFHRPSPYHFVDPPLLRNIERVTSYKLLGVFLTNILPMDMHIHHVLSIVN
jgi:hypothetical protein